MKDVYLVFQCETLLSIFSNAEEAIKYADSMRETHENKFDAYWETQCWKVKEKWDD